MAEADCSVGVYDETESCVEVQDGEYWHNALSPAMTSISILGQLILVSSKQDFSLEDEAPCGGFQYIRQPRSYRACIMQVCQDSLKAYNTADVSMNNIYELSSLIPLKIDEALQIALSGTSAEITQLIPGTLDHIVTILEECKNAAAETAEKFNNVMELIDEVTLTSVASKKTHDTKVSEIEKQREAKRLQLERTKKMEGQLSEGLNEVRQMLRDTKQMYADTSRTSSSSSSNSDDDDDDDTFSSRAWKVAAKAVTLPFKAVTSAFSLSYFTEKQAPSIDPKKDPKVIPDVILNNVNIICNRFGDLLHLLNPQEGEVVNWESIITEERGPSILGKYLKSVTSKLEEEKVLQDEKVLHELCLDYSFLFSEGLELCNKLTKITQESTMKKTQESVLRTTAASLYDEALRLRDLVHEDLGTSPEDHNECRSMSKESKDDEENRTEYSVEIQKLKLKATTIKEQLERHENLLKMFGEENKNQCQLLAELAKLDIQEMDITEIKAMLKTGMNELSKVKSQWTQLVHFFQDVNSLITKRLTHNVKGFKQTVKSVSQKPSKRVQDVIRRQAREGVKAAKVAHTMSSVYVEVSRKHFTGNVAKLGELLYLDPVDDDKEIKKKQKELEVNCQNGLRGIQKIIEDRCCITRKNIGAIEAQYEDGFSTCCMM